jgi:RNA polymerase sigma factor (sigma-70 family)
MASRQRPLPEDRGLLERFRAGDREALAAVFSAYSERLARFLVHGFVFGKGRFDGVSDRHDLHDLVSETFRRAFEARARLGYDGLVPYESYLRAIARNLVVDRLRKKQGRRVALDEMPSAELTFHAQHDRPERSAERLLQDAELARLLKAFVEQLAATERRFVTLRYQRRLPQEQVATRMKRTRRWVRSAEVKLRAELVAFLQDTGYLSGTVCAEGQ